MVLTIISIFLPHPLFPPLQFGEGEGEHSETGGEVKSSIMVKLGKTVYHFYHYNAKPDIFAKAIDLRRSMTKAEKVIWKDSLQEERI